MKKFLRYLLIGAAAVAAYVVCILKKVKGAPRKKQKNNRRLFLMLNQMTQNDLKTYEMESRCQKATRMDSLIGPEEKNGNISQNTR